MRTSDGGRLKRRTLVGLWLALPALAECSASAAAGSERLVLPDFDPRELEHRRVLLAPYASSAVEHGYLPLPRSEGQRLGRSADDARIAPLALFYAYGIRGARATLRESGPRVELGELDVGAWGAYFDRASRFLSVSVDGKQRYAVPELALLTELGASADYVVVVGKLRFEKFSYSVKVGAGSDLERYLRCVARFLVWDYRRVRALAEGEVTVSIGIGDRVLLADWELLGAGLVREILFKPPFVKA